MRSEQVPASSGWFLMLSRLFFGLKAIKKGWAMAECPDLHLFCHFHPKNNVFFDVFFLSGGRFGGDCFWAGMLICLCTVQEGLQMSLADPPPRGVEVQNDPENRDSPPPPPEALFGFSGGGQTPKWWSRGPLLVPGPPWRGLRSVFDSKSVFFHTFGVKNRSGMGGGITEALFWLQGHPSIQKRPSMELTHLFFEV